MDLNDISKQVSSSIMENMSIGRDIKQGLSSWKRKLFGSKKDNEGSVQQGNNEAQNMTEAQREEQLKKQQLESLERLNEIISQSSAAKVNAGFKALQKWYLTMANEASIGMYYIQNHNINVIESIADDKKAIAKANKKLTMTTQQIFNTKKELKEISKLNAEWSNNISQYMDRLGKAL